MRCFAVLAKQELRKEKVYSPMRCVLDYGDFERALNEKRWLENNSIEWRYRFMISLLLNVISSFLKCGREASGNRKTQQWLESYFKISFVLLPVRKSWRIPCLTSEDVDDFISDSEDHKAIYSELGLGKEYIKALETFPRWSVHQVTK